MPNSLPQNISREAIEYMPLYYSGGSQPVSKDSTVIETIDIAAPPAYSRSDPIHGTEALVDRWKNSKNLRKIWGSKNVQKSWKPITLRTPIMGGFVIVSLAVIATLEVLYHRSSRDGNSSGLVFASDMDNIPLSSSFGYLYFPTILSVVYSMVWSWVDLDVKRLEPWFQLSSPNGATASNSLLLQYPFDFLPFIPIAALRRRHWAVCMAGIIMLTVFWIITPLQSAIFNTATVSRSTMVEMGTCGYMVPIDQQGDALNANFQNTAYGITWLGQRLPPYTTEEFAIFPFRPFEDSRESTSSQTETWSTLASAYSTNLACSPANLTLETTGTSYTFNNGKGCSVAELSFSELTGADFMVSYVGYFDNAEVDQALQNPDCPLEFSNTFLAVFAANTSRINSSTWSHMTALSCETTYSTKEIRVSVNASTSDIYSFSETSQNGQGVSTDDLADIFNITNFEYILATGVSSNGQKANLDDVAVLQQYPRLQNRSVSFPASNLVGYAVGLGPSSLANLADPAILAQTFQKAHQVLFVSAFSVLTRPMAGDSLLNRRDGEIGELSAAIIIVRPISLAIEAAMGFIVLLNLALWYFSLRRPSNLRSDPASIGDIMSIVPSSLIFLKKLRDDGHLSAETLASRLSDSMFYFDSTQDNPTIRATPKASSTPHRTKKPTLPEIKQPFTPVRSIELHLGFGTLFALFLSGCLLILALLQISVSKHNGIYIPTTNPIVLSILENYLPTSIATFLEPIWVILNRLLCVLQPFDVLRQGNAIPSRSIEAKYTSLPPQLTIFRALKARHFLLATVCLVAISSNLLSVALSALIYESIVPMTASIITSQNMLPRFTNTFITTNNPAEYFDEFYVALSNVTSGTPLPAWIDRNFFYLPFDISSHVSMYGSSLASTLYQGSTVGFGTKSICVELSPGEADNGFRFQPNANGSIVQFDTSYLDATGAPKTCYSHTQDPRFNQSTTLSDLFLGSASALEVVQQMNTATGTEDDEFCSSRLVFGWVRDNSTLASSPTAVASTNSTPNSTFLSCTFALQVAAFVVSVDYNGHVIVANQTSRFADDLGPYFVAGINETDLLQSGIHLLSATRMNALTEGSAVQNFIWHNDSFTSDWMNVLFAASRGSNALVDPSVPVPNPADVIPLVQDTMQQLFAILLGLNPQLFAVPDTPTSMLAARIIPQSRIFISRTMFFLVIAILFLHLIVAIWYYACRPKKFLPRMPTSIGSIIAYVSGSRALEDFRSEQRKGGNNKEHLYAYGRFLGTDGKTHVGIERQRYIIPLESKNPEVKRRKWGLRQGKGDSKEPKTWI